MNKNCARLAASNYVVMTMAFTIAISVTVFEVIPMRTIFTISAKQEEEHNIANLGSGGVSISLMQDRDEKTLTTGNGRNIFRDRKIQNSINKNNKLIHQGFRLEENVIKLLAKESNKEGVSLSNHVNRILRNHVTDRIHFEELGYIPISKDFLRKIFSTIPEENIDEFARGLGFTIANEYVSSFFPQLDTPTLVEFLDIWLGRFQYCQHRISDSNNKNTKIHTFALNHDINLNFSRALKMILVGLIEPVVKTVVIFGELGSSSITFSFEI